MSAAQGYLEAMEQSVHVGVPHLLQKPLNVSEGQQQSDETALRWWCDQVCTSPIHPYTQPETCTSPQQRLVNYPHQRMLVSTHRSGSEPMTRKHAQHRVTHMRGTTTHARLCTASLPNSHARQTAHGVEAQGRVVHQHGSLQLVGCQATLLGTDPRRLPLVKQHPHGTCGNTNFRRAWWVQSPAPGAALNAHCAVRTANLRRRAEKHDGRTSPRLGRQYVRAQHACII